MTRFSSALAAVLALAGSPALAGEAACWFEGGVVVAPAEVMGVAGDFVIDTATPHTQLAESQAQAAGFAETALTGGVRLAGLDLTGRTVAVADLDMRTGALPTPVAGVIGADVLRPYVLDVSFAPCRLRLSRAGHAPPFGRHAALPIGWIAGRPFVQAAVSDSRLALSARFVPGTGVDRAIRLSDVLADAPGASRRKELYPYGVLAPRLRALSFAGDLAENLASGLIGAEDPALAGQIGAPFLARYRLRFDFPAGRLYLAPAAD